MKYSFDCMEIERRCENWKEIAWDSTRKVFIEGESDYKNLDEEDMQYIEEIMDRFPKLRRLMPDLIFETMTHGEDVYC
jgi:hypothetical protein